MAIESTGHSQDNPRMYELVENAPKTGKSPTIWAFPSIVDWLKVSSQPVAGPWPPHQQPRPDPEEESLPVAVAEPARPARHQRSVPAPQATAPPAAPAPSAPAPPVVAQPEEPAAAEAESSAPPRPTRRLSPESSLQRD